MATRRVIPESTCVGHCYIYDFAFCKSHAELEDVMLKINHFCYDLVSVTQDASGVYTVFFRRLTCC